VWTLRLLGGFELTNGTHAGAQRHTKLGTRAAMALLARLCLRPDSAHPREELVDLLWPDAETDAGRQRLRQTLSTLKQVLEPPEHAGAGVISADRISLRLLPGTVECDALAFEQAFKRGDHDRARALYTGELLPGFFDEWISDERLRLEGLFDRLRAPGPAAAATTTPGSAAVKEPATPTPMPAAAGPQRSALPAYLTRLIGADPQARHLQQEAAEHRLVTLMGPGGTGKTRMAVEVAQALAADGRFELVTFVPLAACQTRQQLLDQMLLSLRLASGPSGALDTLVQALDGRRALLVLDNFEQVVDDGAEVVAELGARLPLLHQLVTSRRALALAGEREVIVAALRLPDADDDADPATQTPLAELALNPSISLFVDRARAARAEFHLHAGNRAALVDLVRLLDGMPLAIELAAARVRSMAPAEMAATLRAARERNLATDGAGQAGMLALLARAPVRGRQDTRHHSMQETIAWSWNLLSPALRDLLAQLTVFQGGFSAAAAQAVCAGSAADTRQVPLRLDELFSHSLLRTAAAEHDAETLRFSLYEPIREFAQDTLAADAAAALRRRHRAWAVAWGRAMPATPPLAHLRTELPNFTAAMVSALADGEPQAAVDIALGLQRALEHAPLPGAGQAALQAALGSCSDAPGRASAMVLLGLMWFRSGRAEDARQLLQQAVDATPAEAPAIRAHALVMRTIVAWGSGERGPLLLDWLDQAQRSAQAAGDAAVQARVDGVRADVLAYRDGDIASAQALHARALAVWLAQGDALAVLRSRFSAAQVTFTANLHEEAIRQVGALAAEAERLQSWLVMAQCLNVRGACHIALRRWPEACRDIGSSLQVAARALDTWNTALALWTLLQPLAQAGQTAAAQQLAGFISGFWAQRFGPLFPAYQSYLRRTRRLAAVTIGQSAAAAAFATGQGLTLAQAVALAQAAVGRV
jgi:predicted ATPase